MGEGEENEAHTEEDRAMMTKRQIWRWLNTLPPDAQVGIDEGGLALQEWNGEAYLEVGGLPEEEGYEDATT
jgi:hypothetical protein